VAKYNRLSVALILVVDLRTVFGFNCAHFFSLQHSMQLQQRLSGGGLDSSVLLQARTPHNRNPAILPAALR
jgi:hypothetical protein